MILVGFGFFKVEGKKFEYPIINNTMRIDVAQSCLNIVQKVDALVNASYTPP